MGIVCDDMLFELFRSKILQVRSTGDFLDVELFKGTLGSCTRFYVRVDMGDGVLVLFFLCA